ncbi:MAG: exodeoxyribonuclease III [Deltaproteobacteria bacterium]|nr:exodeoxyribonuclease III [Deltaproteobacteria bacterium]
MNIEILIAAVKAEVKAYKVPVVDLIAVQTADPFKVLTATILSARTRDETTAAAANRLFAKAPDLKGLAALSANEISKLIYPVGFYKAKAGYLHNLPAALAKFGSQIPAEIDDLVKLPGVGRKTANLVRAVAFGKPAICVDTHVHRIMNIWGYVRTKTPLQTEMELRAKLPPRYWLEINSMLVAFGQGTCKPVAPHCDRCVIQNLCPRIGVTPRKVIKEASPRTIKTGGRTIISWNVNGIRAMEKKGFTGLVNDLRPDILAIQETKAQPSQLSEQLLNIPGYKSFWHSAERKGYSGVAIYTRLEPENIIYGLGNDEFDHEGRVLTLEYDDFFLINSYFPNAQHELKRLTYKLDFNAALHKFANNLATRKTVMVCGDFNVAHRPIDLKNPKSNEMNPGYSAAERAWMDNFLENGFVDTFRKFHQEPEQYTWWSYRFHARARNIGWRIDYFCVNKDSEAKVIDAAILPEIMGSDHCPISVRLA